MSTKKLKLDNLIIYLYAMLIMELHIEKAKAEMKRQGMNYTDLAIKMGKTKQWVYSLLSKNENRTLKTIEELAEGLNIYDPKDLIK